MPKPAGRHTSDKHQFEPTKIFSPAENSKHSEIDISHTQARYTGMLTEEQVESLSNENCTVVRLGEGQLCVVFGYGSQTSSTYRKIDELSGANVLWLKIFGPWWLGPLMWIAASKGGLVKVQARHQVATIIEKLGNLAMVELISCPAALSDQMLDHVRRNSWQNRPGEVAAQDGSYFCFGFDGGSSDSEGGLYTWCAIGDRCSPELTDAIAKYVED